MLFIVVLGTALRLMFINKPEGLWNDEYVSWMIAAIPYGKKFWNAVYGQCHMPFYYFYLKFFIHFFGNSDLMLRLTSVLPGVLSIISMYFVGKEFKDEKLGFLCASVTSISSFLIYFSQEVRFYELLFLFSSLVLLFTLKLLKEQKLSNIIFFILFNLLVIFTHTIGFVFVFLNLLFMTIYLRHAELVLASSQLTKPDRSRNKLGMSTTLWLFIVLSSLAGLPLLFRIITSHPQSQFWGSFTVSKLGFLITDYFSPVLTNIVSAPDKFFYEMNFKFFAFVLVPFLIAIVGIINSLLKNKNILNLFYIALGYILILVLFALSGKIVFVTKYSIEIYPILILTMGFGLLEFKKVWRISLIFLFCFLNLFYLLASTASAPRLPRNEGNKIVADLLKNANLQNGDFILLTYYPKERFEKYFNFSKYKVISINKGTFVQYEGEKFGPEFNREVLSKLKSHQKLAIVILDDISRYSPIQMQMLKSNEKEYKKIPHLFLAFSDIRNKAFETCLKNLQILRLEQKGSWSLITFIKR